MTRRRFECGVVRKCFLQIDDMSLANVTHTWRTSIIAKSYNSTDSIQDLTKLFYCSKGNNSTNSENVPLSQTFDTLTIDVAMSRYLITPLMEYQKI